MTRTYHYFAYGSNLLPQRLAARVAIAADLGRHVLPGHRLRFHKRGRDGSGKGDLATTQDAADCVHGAIYRLDATAMEQLHRIEGVGAGYRVTEVVPAGAPVCLCYVAESSAIDPALQPFDWYLALILEGARQRGCPADYLAWLASVPTVRDADAARAAIAYRLLGDPADSLGPSEGCV